MNNIDNKLDIDSNKANRNKEKIKEIFIIGTLTASIAINIFAINTNNRLSTELQEKISEIKSQSELLDEANQKSDSLSEKINIKNKEIEELKEKVLDAEPWFKMSEEEQRRIDEENKRLEEERLAKEEAERIANEKAEEERRKKEEEERLAKEKAELESRSVTLTNGNYVAGVDFEEGIYDIVAISGNGNVSSDNMFSGGINAIMGVKNNGFYEKEYKNIKLPYGTELTISGVKVKLIPKY